MAWRKFCKTQTMTFSTEMGNSRSSTAQNERNNEKTSTPSVLRRRMQGAKGLEPVVAVEGNGTGNGDTLFGLARIRVIAVSVRNAILC